MECPETKAAVTPMPAALRPRLRRWAQRSLWVAGTSLLLLDCGMHALFGPLALPADTARFDRGLRSVAAPVQAPPGGEREDDRYLPPGLRSGGFE
jgi:hypothetical protein